MGKRKSAVFEGKECPYGFRSYQSDRPASEAGRFGASGLTIGLAVAEIRAKTRDFPVLLGT